MRVSCFGKRAARRLYGLLRLALTFGVARCRLPGATRQLPELEGMSRAETGRFKHYFFGTTYLAAVFAPLRGRGRNRPERGLFALLAALAAFFDDLSDHVVPGPVDGLEAYGRAADPRGLAWRLLQRLRARLPPHLSPRFENTLRQVFEVETVPPEADDTRPDLNRTGKKGGYSVLLFRHLLAPAPGEAETAALYEFGRLIQLSDDIFDVWFDRQQPGANTAALFFLEKNDPQGLSELFENQVSVVENLFGRPALRGGPQALATVEVLIAATRAALSHYTLLQKRHGALPLDNRAVMVVDMARWRNRLRVGMRLVCGS